MAFFLEKILKAKGEFHDVHIICMDSALESVRNSRLHLKYSTSINIIIRHTFHRLFSKKFTDVNVGRSSQADSRREGKGVE